MGVQLTVSHNADLLCHTAANGLLNNATTTEGLFSHNPKNFTILDAPKEDSVPFTPLCMSALAARNYIWSHISTE